MHLSKMRLSIFLMSVMLAYKLDGINALGDLVLDAPAIQFLGTSLEWVIYRANFISNRQDMTFQAIGTGLDNGYRKIVLMRIPAGTSNVTFITSAQVAVSNSALQRYRKLCSLRYDNGRRCLDSVILTPLSDGTTNSTTPSEAIYLTFLGGNTDCLVARILFPGTNNNTIASLLAQSVSVPQCVILRTTREAANQLTQRCLALMNAQCKRNYYPYKNNALLDLPPMNAATALLANGYGYGRFDSTALALALLANQQSSVNLASFLPPVDRNRLLRKARRKGRKSITNDDVIQNIIPTDEYNQITQFVNSHEYKEQLQIIERRLAAMLQDNARTHLSQTQISTVERKSKIQHLDDPTL